MFAFLVPLRSKKGLFPWTCQVSSILDQLTKYTAPVTRQKPEILAINPNVFDKKGNTNLLWQNVKVTLGVRAIFDIYFSTVGKVYVTKPDAYLGRFDRENSRFSVQVHENDHGLCVGTFAHLHVQFRDFVVAWDVWSVRNL